jgi:succinate dehydrogenase/fumarate reductase-like Fe-S protein
VRSWKRIESDLYLGYRALAVHPLKTLLRGDERTGREQFLSNYAAEGLLPIAVEERTLLRGAARCIRCGLCDAQPDAEVTRAYQGPSFIPVAYTRATPHLRDLGAAVREVNQAQLLRGEAACPTRVPLVALARYLRRKVDELDKERSV